MNNQTRPLVRAILLMLQPYVALVIGMGFWVLAAALLL